MKIIKSNLKLTLRMLLELSVAERLQIIEQVLTKSQHNTEVNDNNSFTHKYANTSPFKSSGVAAPEMLYQKPKD